LNNLVPRVSIVQKGLQVGVVLTGLIALAVIVWCSAQILLLFFAAILLAVFFSGLAQFLQRNTRFSYVACVAFSLIGLFYLIVIAALLVGPSMAEKATTLAQAVPKAYHQVLGEIKSTSWGASAIDGIGHALGGSGKDNWNAALQFAGGTIHGLGGMIFAVIIGIFLAFDPQLYRIGFLKLIPKTHRARANEVLEELGFTLWWWLMGQFATMASVGILIGTGLCFLGMPLPGTLGLIAALLSFIPSLGPLISVVPALLLAFTVSPRMVLWVVLLYLVVQILEANVISPLVQKKAISLPPAFVLGSELIMGFLLGGLGLAFATPLVAVILVLVNMLYIQDYLREHGSLPSEQRADHAKVS
jgi:predicted PurR-regulated permease PerM